jgi:hypothetical protein
MSSPEQDFKVPETVAAHPAWARLEDQRGYYDGKAGTYQKQYKRIKLALIGLSAGIPLVAFLQGEVFRFVVAGAGVAIAMLEGLLLLNQYGPLWVKYRSTAEGLKRERWLMLSRAGDYAGKPDDEALRQLAERVEGLLESEQREWSADQQKMLEALARTQALAQASLDETNKRVADAVAATAALKAGDAPPPGPK